MSVHAPYAFVPLSRKVVVPPWGPLVSHDAPFKEGLSGRIELKITTCTPLLVGGARRKPVTPDKEKKVEAKEGEVWPARAPDGTYIIPSSTLQGAIRSVLEIVAFGRMRQVDNLRLGIRDTSAGVRPIYQNKISTSRGQNPRSITSHVQTGELKKVGSAYHLYECNSARVSFWELMRQSRAGNAPTIAVSPSGPLADMKNRPRSGHPDLPAFEKAYNDGDYWGGVSDASRRYRWWTSANRSLTVDMYVGPVEPQSHQNGRLLIPYRKAQFTDPGTWQQKPGRLVFTGKQQHGVGDGDKKQEWFFYYDPKPKLHIVPAEVFARFLAAHEPADGRDPHPTWVHFRDDFQKGKSIPVFWLEEGDKVAQISLAQLMKLSHERSVHDLAKQQPTEGADLATLLFGEVADDKGGGLRRRVVFETARFENRPKLESSDRQILLGPKATFYPAYVAQPAQTDERGHPTGRVEGQTYATYSTPPAPRAGQRDDHAPLVREPRIAGWKRYPARPHASKDLPGLPPDLEDTRQVQTRLHGVPPGQPARCAVVFHNLLPAELGALLWALTWGFEDGKLRRLRHSLGMGRPFGWGQVEIEIDGMHVQPNNDQDQTSPRGSLKGEAAMSAAQKWIDDFKTVMDEAVKEERLGKTWEDSDPVQVLLAMADPSVPSRDNFTLRYMGLEAHASAKNPRRNNGDLLFLRPYPRRDGTAYTPYAGGDDTPHAPGAGRDGGAGDAPPAAGGPLAPGDRVDSPAGPGVIVEGDAPPAQHLVQPDSGGKARPFHRRSLRRAPPQP